MRVVLIGICHELQWKDPTGDLKALIQKMLSDCAVDLVAEEAAGLPTTVGQRLAFKHDKPWLELDMNIAERKLAGIDEGLKARRFQPLNPDINGDIKHLYLRHEDGIREAEWVSRLLRTRCSTALCLCGIMHVNTFKQNLEKQGCAVETLEISHLNWFQDTCGKISIVEENGDSWCEVRR